MGDINSTTNIITQIINQTDVNLANQLLSKVPFIGDNHDLQALFLLLTFIVIAKLFLLFTKIFVRRITQKTKFEWDDKLLDLIEKPIAVVIVLIGIKIALVPLNIVGEYKDWISSFIITLIIIAVAYSINLIMHLVLEIWGKNFAKKTKTKIDEELLPLIHKTLSVLIILIASLFILKEWGINIGPLLASLGIAGIAIGLALQPTLSNIFAGIALIADKNFKRGDIVEVDGLNGTIHDVGLRTTRIKTLDNDMVTFPNNNLANMRIINHLQPDTTARIHIPIGVAYGSDIDKVKKIIYVAIDKNKKILQEPKPQVLFAEMGSFALNFNVYCWINDFNLRWEVKDELLSEIYNSLKKNKVDIPFPTTTVYLKK